ncbi:MAG TPA: hypothetical protein VN969_35645 [Streptosporangiaceae bacterium]|jgi:hypothetical protein|nr:hypothetical protein [Streptosporangiaceae bacterium]
MTFANVLIYVLLIALVLARRFRGHPIGNLKNLLVLPVVVTVIGFVDLSHGGLKPLAVTLTVIGAMLSLGLGALRGRADKVSEQDGSPYVQWGVLSLVLFCVNIAAKLVLDVIGVAAGETFSTAGKSLIFTLGLTLVGEAIVLSLRSGATWPGTARAGTMRSGTGRSGAVSQQPRTGEAPAAWAPEPVPASMYRDEDREDRRDRHEHHHDHHHDHHGRRED